MLKIIIKIFKFKKIQIILILVLLLAFNQVQCQKFNKGSLRGTWTFVDKKDSITFYFRDSSVFNIKFYPKLMPDPPPGHYELDTRVYPPILKTTVTDVGDIPNINRYYIYFLNKDSFELRLYEDHSFYGLFRRIGK